MDNKVLITRFRTQENIIFAEVSYMEQRKFVPVKRHEDIIYITLGKREDKSFVRYELNHIDKVALNYFLDKGFNYSDRKEKIETKPFYDLDEIKSIPIERVAETWGLKVIKNGSTLWVNVRGEKTPSCKLYGNTNTFCDFGNGNKGGNVINFVSYISSCDNEKAIYELANTFGIQPLNNYKNNTFELSNLQYEKINIQADLATKNFSFDLDTYSTEQTKMFADKYRISVQQLKNDYPNIYENMLKQKSLPYIYDLKNELFYRCDNADDLYKMLKVDILSDSGYLIELDSFAKELTIAERILESAAKGTNIKFKATQYNVSDIITNIRNGTLSFEIGNTRYNDLKTYEKKNNGYVYYKEINYSHYQLIRDDLENIKYSAFLKNDSKKGKIVNIAFSKENAIAIDTILQKGIDKKTSR